MKDAKYNANAETNKEEEKKEEPKQQKKPETKKRPPSGKRKQAKKSHQPDESDTFLTDLLRGETNKAPSKTPSNIAEEDEDYTEELQDIVYDYE